MKTQMLMLTVAMTMLCIRCDENESEKVYDPEETLVTIDASECSGLFNYQIFLVADNEESNSIYMEIPEGETLVIKRGEIIKGDLVDLHFLFLKKLSTESWRICSYYEIPPGKEINFKAYYQSLFVTGTTSSSAPGEAIITFSDIPDFEVASRTYIRPSHSHTYNTLEYPCFPEYETGKLFYVCLQHGNSAGYKLETIPDVSNYAVSLSGLNTSMTKYAFPKEPDNPKYITVEAYGSAGTVEIFGLEYINESIFSGDHVDVFVPIGLPQMVNFSTEIRTYKNGGTDGMRINYFYDNTVVTDCSFLDAGVSINHTDGQMPIINTQSDAFDVMKTKIAYTFTNTWTLFTPRGVDYSMPEFPEDLLETISEYISFTDLFSGFIHVDADAINDSRIADYDEAIDFYLLKTNNFDQESYQIKTDNSRYTPN